MPYAVAAYNEIFDNGYSPQDVTSWNMNVDLLVHGSPCFLAGELVNTNKGLIPIEEIELGMMVRSHDGTYNKVIETMKNNKNNYIFDIKCGPTHRINTTFNHPFYVRREGENQWVEAHELTKDDYMIIPANEKQEQVQWTGTELYYNRHTELSNKLPFNDSRFWYLIGRFIGDGWVNKRKDRNNNISGIKICCGKHEIDELKDKLEGLFNYCLVEEETVFKLQFTNKELGEFCSQFGIGSSNKHIPQNILDLKEEYLLPLYEGIIDSDGNITKEELHRVTTVSKTLVYSIGELVLKLFKVPYFISKTTRPDTCIIEGRTVNQKDTYTVSWRLNGKNIKSMNYVEDGVLYARIRDIRSYNELKDVYNIEVENTHSYCVNNIATHNCQDWSNNGLNDVSTGRSILYERTLEIIEKELNPRPKVVIWENVTGLISKKHIDHFNHYLSKMEHLGYRNTFKILNSKDFGMAQSRDRIFTISILDGEVFNFPEPHELTKPLSHYIDRSVNPEEYALSDNEKKLFFEVDGKLYVHVNNKSRFMEVFDGDSVNVERPNSKTRRGRVQRGMVPTLTTNPHVAVYYDGILRKITPRECWRLLGFTDTDYDRVEATDIPRAALYKLPGNSIVVNVLESIFKELISQGFIDAGLK